MMETGRIQSIRDEEGYDAALRRINDIFQAEQGTPLGDERDVLVDLVELYESRRHPIPRNDIPDAVPMVREAALSDLARGILGRFLDMEQVRRLEPREMDGEGRERERQALLDSMGERQPLALSGQLPDGSQVMAAVEIALEADETAMRNAMRSARALGKFTGRITRPVVACLEISQEAPLLPVTLYSLRGAMKRCGRCMRTVGPE